MAMNDRSIASDRGGSTSCTVCGKWPATLYVDLAVKNGPRICEACANDGTYERVNGVLRKKKAKK